MALTTKISLSGPDSVGMGAENFPWVHVCSEHVYSCVNGGKRLLCPPCCSVLLLCVHSSSPGLDGGAAVTLLKQLIPTGVSGNMFLL